VINDLAAKKTFDPATGIYLTRAGGSLAEAIYSFRVVDGDAVITIDTTRNVRETAPRTFIINYELVSRPLFSGSAKRRGYDEIIRALLETFADYYGDWNGERGTFTTTVSIDEPFLSALADWEKAPGSPVFAPASL
jgi:hypothetical protein